MTFTAYQVLVVLILAFLTHCLDQFMIYCAFFFLLPQLNCQATNFSSTSGLEMFLRRLRDSYVLFGSCELSENTRGIFIGNTVPFVACAVLLLDGNLGANSWWDGSAHSSRVGQVCMALAYSVNYSVFLINLVPSDKGVSLNMKKRQEKERPIAMCLHFKYFFPLNPIRLLHQEKIKSVIACCLCQHSLKRHLISEDEVAI